MGAGEKKNVFLQLFYQSIYSTRVNSAKYRSLQNKKI